MSPLDRPLPPTGEEIHIPGPSGQPIALAVGITIALIGVTTNLVILIIGVVVTVVTLFLWIRDAVSEYEHLPLEHAPATHDTVPRQQDQPHATSEPQ